MAAVSSFTVKNNASFLPRTIRASNSIGGLQSWRVPSHDISFKILSRTQVIAPWRLYSSLSDSTKSGESDKATIESPQKPEDDSGAQSGNGASVGTVLYDDDLELPQLNGWAQFLVKLRMLTALPWQRVKKGSVLTIKLSGPVSEQLVSKFSSVTSLPQVIENLKKAASDPRVSGLVLKIEPLSCGWGKVEELKRHILYFKKSGKFSIAYLAVGGEKEFYLASSCDELYTPPGAYVSLRGLAVQGQFLGGVLEKVGVEPQVERIGKYKSAGDQLSRKDMSEPNREMLTAILDDVYTKWANGVVHARGKTLADLEQLLSDGVVAMEELKERGWITDIKYESEIEDMLKKRLELGEKEKVTFVNNKKYSRVQPWTLAVGGTGDRIAVIRAVGAISRGRGGATSMSGIAADDIIKKIRMVKENKSFKALVLRIDSPGGDALASDLMWQEIRQLALEKPVVASMADVAASGGFYMAMAAQSIVAEELTLTGSIGVVLGKFNLKDLYKRIGFAKETISRGRFAEVDSDQRSFTPDEEAFFKKGAQNAYQSFRDKAALSRSMKPDQMEEYAQGRVWTGKAASERGLIDFVGGISTAIAIAKDKAGIAKDKKVRLVELSRQKPSLQMILAGGARVASLAFGSAEDRRMAIREILAETLFSGDFDMASAGQPQALMEDVWLDGFSTREVSLTDGGLPAFLSQSSRK